MTNDGPLISSPTLSVEEALDKARCSQNQLFLKAESGELPVYVIADNWSAGRIYEIDNSVTVDFSKPFTSYRSPDLSKLPASDAANFDPKFDAWYREQSTLDCNQDVIVGNQTSYGRLHSFWRALHTLTDYQPIAAETFKAYRLNPENAEVIIDLNRKLKLIDKVHERYISLEPTILLEDALSEGRLVVMTADLKRLLNERPDGNIYDMMDHPFWPDELGFAIAAWQNVSETYRQSGEKPRELILEWLKHKTTGLSTAAIERISTVANWDKSAGPAKKT